MTEPGGNYRTTDDGTMRQLCDSCGLYDAQRTITIDLMEYNYCMECVMTLRMMSLQNQTFIRWERIRNGEEN